MQFIDLAAQQSRIKNRIDTRIAQVLSHGEYIMGPEVEELEAALSIFCGAKHSLTCANGTDALLLALMALNVGPKHAVLCPSFTFAATAEVVPSLGATPVFVDCDPNTYNIDPHSLARSIDHSKNLGLIPSVVITVDLFGLPADYDGIEEIVASEGMKLISDSAQGFGGVYKGRRSGAIGDLCTTSFFPAKPLGCYGDGGAIFTDNDDFAEVLKSCRVHGKGNHKYDYQRIGMNSRLDTLQAAILCEKLQIFQDELDQRNRVAQVYTGALSNKLITPHVPAGLVSSWAQYTVRPHSGHSRVAIMSHLREAGVPTAVYYPMPLHVQSAYKRFPSDPNGLPVSEELAAKVFSLPMHPYLTSQEQDRVISAIYDCI